MPSFSQPSHEERRQMAAKAKQAALLKLQARPTLTREEITERKAAQVVREQNEALAREQKRAAFAQKKADDKAKRLEARAAEEAARSKVARKKTPEEEKAARDARYAKRKNAKR